MNDRAELHRVPLIGQVDVLVIGAGSSAVAAAVETRQTGGTAMVVSDRSYFGDESAGALRLYDVGACDDPLFRAVFPATGAAPPYPGAIKRRLEQSLLDAGAPFLFHARPIGVLHDAQGTLCGVVIAARTSLYAIGCRVVVDATRHGLIGRLTRSTPAARREPTKRMSWVILSPNLPKLTAFDVRPMGEPFVLDGADGKHEAVYAYELTCTRPAHGDTPAELAGVEHRLRSQLSHATLWASATTIPDHTVAHMPASGGLSDDPLSLKAAQFQLRPQVLLLNSMLPLSDKGVLLLDEPATAIPLGRLVGRAACDAARAHAAAHSETDWSTVRLDAGEDEAAGPFAFAASFVRPTSGLPALMLDFAAAPLLDSYDVVVAGGGTGGAPAGVGAAKQGARTLVLEMQHTLGGVGTTGMISTYWFGNRVGYTAWLDGQVCDAMGLTGDDRKTRSWNPNVKDICHQRALLDAGGTAWLGSFAFGVTMKGDRVSGVLVSTPYGSGLVRAGAVVDATGCADIPAAAGAPCRVIDERHVAVQGAGLSPRRPGPAGRNSDHNFVDDTDVAGVTHAFVNARAKFTDAFDVTQLIDSRERRQIRGDVELSPLDFLAKRTFPDTITTAMSNFDTHGFTIHPVFVAAPPDKIGIFAHVPFRCLLPRGLDGVLVTGLGMSAHRDALPVVRMQADVQNQGFAAGTAAARSAAERVPLRKLDIRELQRELVNVGILDAAVLAHSDSFPLPTEMVDAALESGPTDLFQSAVLIAHPEKSLPGLRKQLTSSDPTKREGAALLLGLFGCEEAAEPLAKLVVASAWDEGWNFRGMGQFGRSMSRVDGLIIALGKTGSPLGIEPIVSKIESLDETAAFSHCRAVSVAASSLAHPKLSAALARLLTTPGMQGHAQLDTAEVVRHANPDPVETDARTWSLRELLLARGLYLCGDVNDLGRSILSTYSRDLRGAYARHAQAVLATSDIASLRVEVL